MKKTLQECKEIVADKIHQIDYEWCVNYLNSNRIIKLCDLANKMYYEQSEAESLKAENERLKEENGWLKDLINVIEQINDNSNIDSTIKEFKELITNP